MLKTAVTDQIALGAVQAALAVAVTLAVMLLARARAIHLERDVAVAVVRGIAQILAVGSVLLLLLRGPRWTGSSRKIGRAHV